MAGDGNVGVLSEAESVDISSDLPEDSHQYVDDAFEKKGNPSRDFPPPAIEKGDSATQMVIETSGESDMQVGLC